MVGSTGSVLRCRPSTVSSSSGVMAPALRTRHDTTQQDHRRLSGPSRRMNHHFHQPCPPTHAHDAPMWRSSSRALRRAMSEGGVTACAVGVRDVSKVRRSKHVVCQCRLCVRVYVRVRRSGGRSPGWMVPSRPRVRRDTHLLASFSFLSFSFPSCSSDRPTDLLHELLHAAAPRPRHAPQRPHLSSSSHSCRAVPRVRHSLPRMPYYRHPSTNQSIQSVAPLTWRHMEARGVRTISGSWKGMSPSSNLRCGNRCQHLPGCTRPARPGLMVVVWSGWADYFI